jgi:hypothetical protein
MGEITPESYSWRSYKDGVKVWMKLLQNLIYGGIVRTGDAGKNLDSHNPRVINDAIFWMVTMVK